MDRHQEIINLKPQNEFFIGIDSDGSVFDTMEIKHKECFCPTLIKHFELQDISEYVREVWDFVALYSQTRGLNRFRGLVKTFDYLSERPEVTSRKQSFINIDPIREWVQQETKLSNETLKAYADKTGHEVLYRALRWSEDAYEEIKKKVHDLPPFRFAYESLEKLSERADAVVVSHSNVEALQREWKDGSVDRFVDFIAGQEYGIKEELLRYSAVGKYKEDKMMMIGDAPDDLKAAKHNGMLFFPIIPGEEEASWERFYKEAVDKFFLGTYAGLYEEELIEEFDKRLPEKPKWKNN